MGLFNKNVKILGIFAHREDHIVCGWPVFQDNIPRKFLVTCTSDGMEPFVQSCNLGHISCFKRIGLPNNFSCTGPGLKPAFAMGHVCRVIHEAAECIDPDFIFTHNPYGEYGHYDHRNLFDIVCESFPNKKILITDIIARSNCTPLSNIRLRAYNKIYSTLFGETEPDKKFYQSHADLFSKYGMWTTSRYLNLPKYPDGSAKIYIIEPENVDT
jgi:hypothetical protein